MLFGMDYLTIAFLAGLVVFLIGLIKNIEILLKIAIACMAVSFVLGMIGLI